MAMALVDTGARNTGNLRLIRARRLSALLQSLAERLRNVCGHLGRQSRPSPVRLRVVQSRSNKAALLQTLRRLLPHKVFTAPQARQRQTRNYPQPCPMLGSGRLPQREIQRQRLPNGMRVINGFQEHRQQTAGLRRHIEAIDNGRY